MAQHRGRGMVPILILISLQIFADVKAASRISIPSTVKWSEIGGSCSEWVPAPQNTVDAFKNVLAAGFDGVGASDFSNISVLCGNELAIAFEISLTPSANEFDKKATDLVAMLRSYVTNDEARAQLTVNLQSVGYPSTFGQMELALWRCESTGCVFLTDSAENIVVLWLGRNFTTPTTTTAPPTQAPEECTFHMLWLPEDLFKDSCGLQAAVIFGGFALLIICCPTIICICRREKKKIEALVCTFAPPSTLFVGVEQQEEDKTPGEEKAPEESNAIDDNATDDVPSVITSLKDKALSKNCATLDESLLKLHPAYRDHTDVEFYSVKNACWVHATLHIFAAAPGNVDSKSNSSPFSRNNSKGDGDEPSPRPRPTTRKSDRSYQSTHSQDGSRNIYGVELHMGDAQALQWRYNIELNQLRLPLSQNETVEVYSKNGTWVEGQVQGPRCSNRKQLGHQAFRQQLGYNVRLSSGALQKNLPAEHIRRCFPPGSAVEYYAGPDLGWLPGEVGSVKDSAANNLKEFTMQPWRKLKKQRTNQSNSLHSSASKNLQMTNSATGICTVSNANESPVRSPVPSPPASEAGGMTANDDSNPTVNLTLTSNTSQLGKRRNDAWSNALSIQSNFRASGLNGSTNAMNATPSEDSGSTAGDISLNRPNLWVMVAIKASVSTLDGSTSTEKQASVSRPNGITSAEKEAPVSKLGESISEEVDDEALKEEEDLENPTSVSRIGESISEEVDDKALKEDLENPSLSLGLTASQTPHTNGSSDLEIASFLVRSCGLRNCCWL